MSGMWLKLIRISRENGPATRYALTQIKGA